MTRPLRGVVAGAGYFSQFHYDAWRRLPGVSIVALCDPDPARRAAAARSHGVPATYDDVATMLDVERPDFIDIITPPETHAALVALAAERGVAVLCQKALAPSFAEAQAIVACAARAGIVFMVHDNFRFQPWHREIRRLIEAGAIGRLQGITCRTRLGDGRAPDAYLSRQPYFRTMPRFLIFETGVHLIDVFRYLGGDIVDVFAMTDRLNPAIAGEDRALLVCRFAAGGRAVWDADRVHAPTASDPRYTFGHFLIEGSEASLELRETGALARLAHGEPATPLAYPVSDAGFAGDSVRETFAHFLEAVRERGPHELGGADYLRTLAVQEAAYRSAASGRIEPAK